MTDINQQAQAALYELLALSFGYPRKELAQALIAGEYRDTVHELADILDLSLEEDFDSYLLPYEQAEEKDTVHTLRIEYTRLFIGSSEPLVSPYEGVWKAKDDGVQPLLFVNPHSVAVEKFYAEYGIGNPEGKNEPLDHISSELEFLQFLTLVSSGMMSTPLSSEKTIDEHTQAIEQFKQEHTSTWVPKFAEAVIEQTKEPFFVGAATLIRQAV